MLDRVGFYCWAGPGTIRMLKLKYFNPIINYESLYKSYDYEHLKTVQDLIHITDIWVTYSWGFHEKNEKEDYEFLRSKIPNFKKLNLKSHAYIQGPNLVYNDFKEHDMWCRDERGNLIAFYRGRFLTCVNNPNFQDYYLKKIENACKEDIDGIFVDNLIFGQFGLISKKDSTRITFYGCNCEFCQKKYKKTTGESIPTNVLKESPERLKQYTKFRIDSLYEFKKKISEITHRYKKEFGSNSLDPKFDSENYFGLDTHRSAQLQDYILFENHSIPSSKRNNLYIDKIAKEIHKPVFVVSYKHGIGFDGHFNQNDLNSIFTEASHLDFYPCIKGSEYIDNKTWNNFDPESFEKPLIFDSFLNIKGYKKKKIREKHQNAFMKIMQSVILDNHFTRKVTNRTFNPFMRYYYNNKTFRKLFTWLYKIALKSH